MTANTPTPTPTPALGEPGLARGARVVHLSAHVERSELALLVAQAEAASEHGEEVSVGDVLRRSIQIAAQVMLAEARGGQCVVERDGVRELVDTSLPAPLPERGALR